MKSYDSIPDAVSELKQRGYTAEFEARPYCLYCGDMDLRMNHDEFQIDEVYRIDKDADPNHSAIVYAISSITGVKGTMVDTGGADVEDKQQESTKELA